VGIGLGFIKHKSCLPSQPAALPRVVKLNDKLVEGS